MLGNCTDLALTAYEAYTMQMMLTCSLTNCKCIAITLCEHMLPCCSHVLSLDNDSDDQLPSCSRCLLSMHSSLLQCWPAGKVAKLFTLPVWLLRNGWVQGSSHYELWLVLAQTPCCRLLALLTGSQANRSWPGMTRSLLLRRQSSHRQQKSNKTTDRGFALE
jgi:hypothetical protein